MPLATIEKAIAAIARGEIVVVVDDEDRENEGDLIMAAEFATPPAIAFFVRLGLALGFRDYELSILSFAWAAPLFTRALDLRQLNLARPAA